MSRVSEIETHLVSLGFPIPNKLTDLIDYDLTTSAGRSRGCISPGGSSVRDWIRLWLSDHKLLPIGGIEQDMQHVTAILHFWSWDEERYGPQPKGSIGTNLDTMQSPTWRLKNKDAKPINKVAFRVTGIQS